MHLQSCSVIRTWPSIHRVIYRCFLMLSFWTHFTRICLCICDPRILGFSTSPRDYQTGSPGVQVHRAALSPHSGSHYEKSVAPTDLILKNKKRQNPQTGRTRGNALWGVPRTDGTREKRPRDNNRFQCLASWESLVIR